ncbi:MAG: hypothetical protein OEZ36_13405 [Spirochaetota bacterium]|nr:hypothetical protein [Spirochaetota bacterium]
MKLYTHVLAYTLILIFCVTLDSAWSRDSDASAERTLTLINQGNRDILRNITYKDLESAFEISRLTYRGRIPFGQRGKVVNSALKGLFNRDPRVQLICVEILRGFQPDRFMAPEVYLLYKQISEYKMLFPGKTQKHRDYYEYKNLLGQMVKKSTSAELTILYKFVRRDKLIQHMLKTDNTFLKSAGKDDYFILSKKIDGEPDETVPLKNYGETRFFNLDQLHIIIHGLDNPNLTVRQGLAKYLIRFYNLNARKMRVEYRNQIMLALKRAYDDDIINKPKLIRVY